MFEAIKKLFSGAQTESSEPVLDANNAPVCAVALLVEGALADGIYADIEQDMILGIIRNVFSLEDEAARELLEAAESCAEMAVDHYAFTRVVKTGMPKAQRIALVGHLWDVTFADGEESPFEDAFIRRVAALLAVTDHERAHAKKAAISRRKDG